MAKGIAVIGAAFGDEGKGLMTDYLAYNMAKPIVIRFNGGAQAGHTVVTPAGNRHVFHHFGSGSLAGAPTYLSEYFILNPVLFVRELAELEDVTSFDKVNLDVFVDPDCKFTLLSDMMLNQWAEEARGRGRHGSCGVGIGETVERCTRNRQPATLLKEGWHEKHGWSEMSLRRMILDVNREWVPMRAIELGVELTPERLDYLNDPKNIQTWIFNFRSMCNRIHVMQPRWLLGHGYQTFIFEGAQGLGLDGRIDSPYFPHVTRSRTGRNNVVLLAERLGLKELEIVYMTRSYLTRHGAGVMPYEKMILPYDGIVDETNVPHDFQGNLRFAYLNLDLLISNIATDIVSIETNIEITSCLAITCMDQLNDIAHYHSYNLERKCRYHELPSHVQKGTQVRVGYLSFGPTRNNVVLGGEYIARNAKVEPEKAVN